MIDQNTIISMLNEVIPQMQKSENPEETLLKFAADKNLPPSVLERMTHMFNALKTNINIPSLGKFNCTYNRYLGVKERFKYIKYIKNGNKEN